ncbi:uncharacterized protein isoform X2 [Leptinotarsa decemlineata]|uniref:uncharacterized protein isoform X2 n=1 Tax=Leptinotarsa decemlineata TaxID=7539 RepID=UPI003D309547
MMSHSSNKTEDDSRHSLRKLHAEFKAKRKLRIPEEIQKIQKEFCKTYRLFQAVELNNVEKVKNLLQQGVSANSTDFELRSVLHVAVSKGYADIVELLLKYGADPNKKDMIHNTPLHLAVCLHNISIISMLINANADVSSLDNNGRTAFQLASSKLKLLQSSWRAGTIEMIKLREEMKQIVYQNIKKKNSFGSHFVFTVLFCPSGNYSM